MTAVTGTDRMAVRPPVARTAVLLYNPPPVANENGQTSGALSGGGGGAPALRSARVVLDGKPLTLGTLDTLLGCPLQVELEQPLWDRIEAGARRVERIVASGTPAYGINTGFGSLCTKPISADQLRELQRNLILSHAVGVGDPAPAQVVRWMMLFKILALSHGVSGVSRATLECLVHMLEADLLPLIPTQGSLGASGDLAPLAHMVLPMIGLGSVRGSGRTAPLQSAGTPALRSAQDGLRAPLCDQPAVEAFKRSRIDTVTLGPKEGLALINGTQFMTAYAATIVVRARRLMKHADVVATMSLESLKGSIRPFDERLNNLRPHKGALEVADNVRRMIAESQILASHADCDRVQDPYSLRCVAQVHGASRDALRHVSEVVETEINSVTDNPLILENDEVISGGLFHGQPLALVLDYLAIALAELGSISERRVYLLLSGAEGLPVLLMRDTGLNSGFMLPQYTAAALVSENKGLCTPSSVDSIPTSLGQEDHVSMGARGAVKCLQVLENTETVLAIEQMCAAQALDYRAPLQAGIGPRSAHLEVRREISHTEKDRLFGDDMAKSLELLRSQRVVQAVERESGPLW